MASSGPACSSGNKSNDQKTSLNQVSGGYVKLNVGGSPFCTTLKTLTKFDSMLTLMFSGKYPIETDSKGFKMIDRSGKHFDKILNFLRDESIPLPETRIELEELLVEANFYQIKELINEIKQKISFFSPSLLNIYTKKVIVLGGEDGESMENLSKRLLKPIVLLKMDLGLKLESKHHSSNSEINWTSENSITNRLKNLQLFDKLSIDFAGKVLFFRRDGGSCTIKWQFFVDGLESPLELDCLGPIRGGGRVIEFLETSVYHFLSKICIYSHKS
ncbi:BTB/POZ domain-containing adapter for CUL3-mediated RhoA degradation protein 3-like [Brevipalpus obovatus]|uniref:BTB/POZ domain-containing adapter for CUL3-mediated RhoA degradation protein 3-like n=1 Tax=Brevipalpus obovatus TaxID=246614 RepID=UPI003D9FAC9E